MILGSFAACTGGRIFGKISLLEVHSRCDGCYHVLRGWRTIPLVGFVVQGGKCGYCNVKIPFLYPVIEIISGFATVMIWRIFGWPAFIYIELLLVLSIIHIVSDIQYRLLSDTVTFIIVFIVTLYVVRTKLISLDNLFFGCIFFLTIAFLSYVVAWRTKSDALGYGDIKLLVALIPLIRDSQAIAQSFCFIGLGGIVMWLLFRKIDKIYPFAPSILGALWFNLITL